MVDKVEEQARNTIRRFGMVQPGQRVLVALSGGADSICLLHVLVRLRESLAIDVIALHVDHALRPESATQAQEVQRICVGLGVPCALRRVSVPERRARTGESVQDAARKMRYAALRKEAEATGAHRIAVAHNADDQAETVLMRLLRGAGMTGLAGIPPVRGSIIRPLIEVWGRDIRLYCKRHGLPIVEDPSNMSDAYLRNRLRHHLIPYIEEEYNPRFRAALCRTAELLRTDEETLETWVEEVYASPAVDGQDGSGWARVLAKGLSQLPVGLARRVLRHAYRKATGSMSPSLERLDAALALCREGARGGARIELGGGAYAERKGPYVEVHAGEANRV